MSAVWFNGRIFEGLISLDPRDRGLLLGDGLFETFAVMNRIAMWRTEHLARLTAAARELGISCDPAAIDAAIDRVLGQSRGGFEVLRLSLTRGAVPRGFAFDGEAPGLLITLAPMPLRRLFQPVRLVTAAIRRNEFAPSSRLKTLSQIDDIAAARQAAAAGADDALMLITAGQAACSTISNLFLVKGAELITPSLDQGILPGIMRAALLQLAPALGLTAIERPVPPVELASAGAVFLTNSLRFIRPVEILDGEPLGRQPLDSFIKALSLNARQQCGRDPRSI